MAMAINNSIGGELPIISGIEAVGETTHHNEDVLNEAGWIRDGTKSVFTKKENDMHRVLLSPGVSEGGVGVYWFDIGGTNLDYIEKFTDNHPRLLVRIVPDLFFGTTLQSIQPLLAEHLKRKNTKHKDIWGIYIDMPMRKSGEKAALYSQRDKSERVASMLMNKSKTAEWLKQ